MTQLAKNAGSRVVRWCARLIGQDLIGQDLTGHDKRQQKKPRQHWYDVDHCGLH